MTKLFDEAVAAARKLSAGKQNEIAHMVQLYSELPLVRLSTAELADLVEADEEIARGEFTTDDELRDLWSKYGR